MLALEKQVLGWELCPPTYSLLTLFSVCIFQRMGIAETSSKLGGDGREGVGKHVPNAPRLQVPGCLEMQEKSEFQFEHL